MSFIVLMIIGIICTIIYFKSRGNWGGGDNNNNHESHDEQGAFLERLRTGRLTDDDYDANGNHKF